MNFVFKEAWNMKILGHRGYSGSYPENTMLAFQKAIDAGADGIETDVQLSKDGVMMIMHDEKLDRTTDGKGNLRDYTCEELKTFNAANLYKGFCEPQEIPTFEEFCIWMKDKDIITNVELKNSVFYYVGLEEKVLEMIRKYDLEDRIIISSFNWASAIKFKKMAPEVRCGALVSRPVLENAGHFCREFGLDYYHPNCAMLTSDIVKECYEQGIGINTWTVNDMATYCQVSNWDVNVMISNYPDTSIFNAQKLDKKL